MVLDGRALNVVETAREKNMSEELKKCPFCGGEVRLTNIDPNDDYYMMECQNENCNAATCFGEVDKEGIKERWNRRVLDER